MQAFLNFLFVSHKNKYLRVKLFSKGLSLPLQQRFKQGRDTRFSSKSMLQNFVSYIKVKSESHGTVTDELQQGKLMKFICKSVRNILVVNQLELMIKIALTKEWCALWLSA